MYGLRQGYGYGFCQEAWRDTHTVVSAVLHGVHAGIICKPGFVKHLGQTAVKILQSKYCSQQSAACYKLSKRDFIYWEPWGNS